MLDLNKDIQFIKGVGPTRAELLRKIGISNLKIIKITELLQLSIQI